MWFKKLTNSKDVSLFNYRGDIPVILLYQVITKFILILFLKMFNELQGIILWNDDKPAFSTGKIPELMSSWQGMVVFALGLISLIIYTIFDINTTIIMSDRLLHRKKINIWSLLKDTFKSTRYFATPLGILVAVYAAIVGPLFGAPMGIAITTNLSVPEKIISLIFDDKLNRVLYCGMLAVLLIFGFYFLFVFQYTILGKMRVWRALLESGKVVTENWRDILQRLGTFLVRSVLILVAIGGVFYILPLTLLHQVTHKGYWYYF
jgi:glycerophosphoryl diester phosphodiesterase